MTTRFMLWDWSNRLGPLPQAGVQGTGSFGYRLAKYLGNRGIAVFEVNRPNRMSATRTVPCRC